jgi:carbamoyl-phosphate synthase small subunit
VQHCLVGSEMCIRDSDRTVAALAMRDQPVFGVQYHPEASPGPHDADHHFARFTALMAERR